MEAASAVSVPVETLTQNILLRRSNSLPILCVMIQEQRLIIPEFAFIVPVFLAHRVPDDEGTQRPAGFGKESRSDHAQQVSCGVQ